MLPPADTVRGRVSHYIYRHRDLLRAPVLEVGSRWPHAGADNIADFRTQCEFDGEWVGLDFQAGHNVDLIHDICEGPPDGEYGSAVCGEVLEHVRYPSLMLDHIFMALLPGSWVVMTSPFAHPVHCYPDDYWRVTPSGMRALLEDAGFVDVEAEGIGSVSIPLQQHNGLLHGDLPMHIGGVGRRP